VINNWKQSAFFLAFMSATIFAQAADPVRFISCPIYRDAQAGRKSGCWLGDNPASGLRYDFTLSPTKPLLGRPILVEGFVNEDISEEACGGKVLHPARVSLLPGNCKSHFLPAEGYKAHRFKLPRRNIRPLYEARELPEQPFVEKTFYIPFDFGRDFIIYQLSDYYIDQATKYAIDTQAKRVEIKGFAATTPSNVSGKVLIEDQQVAIDRTKIVKTWFTNLGVPEDKIVVSTGEDSIEPSMEGADGLPEASRRRVEIKIYP
jgi:outer membrane protein OmpA-like peptidoglycan-associated protein